MKTKVNKRRFLAALSAAMLISAALVASCTDPLSDYLGKQVKQDDSALPPAGKGLVRINVTDKGLRTILPDLPAVEDLFYTIQFTASTDPTSNNAIFPETAGDRASYQDLNGQPIPLNPDNYIVIITAYDTDGLTLPGSPVAGWTSPATVSVTSSDSTPITANLYGFTTNTGNFEYDITVPALPTFSGTLWAITTPPISYNTHEMVILNSSDTPVGGLPINLSVGQVTNTGFPITLPGGYYTVKITLTADHCQDRIANYVMHIYDGMTSKLTYSIPTINQNEFSVKFDVNGIANDDGGTFDSTDTNPVIQGGISFIGTATDPGTLLSTTHDFQGWYSGKGLSDGEVTGDEWDFGTSKVFRDTTLYAKWTAKGAVDDPIDIAAIDGVTPPVAGQTPVTVISPSSQYTGAISWSPSDPTFVAGTSYTATITLLPKTGYTLTGVAADFFTVEGATSVSNAANSGTITAVFPNTPTTITDMTILGVTAPSAGGTPVTSITSNTQYNAAVTWDNGNPSVFAPATTYQATITLTAKAGYTLTGVTANFFTVSGATTITPNSANSGTLTVEFSATETTINIAAIGGVTAPSAGQTPVTSDTTSNAQYNVAVSWSPSVSGTFAPETQYTATITLTAKTGYTLIGVAASYFTVSGATVITQNSANAGVLTVEFSATETTITDMTILGVTPPVAGGTPAGTITPSSQYTGTISWSPTVSGTFAASTTYTATITLSPASTYTLTGVAANSFTVADATTVSYTPGSNTVIAVFPATAPAGITITLFKDANVTSNHSTVSFSDIYNGTESLIFTLQNGPYGTVEWKLGDYVITEGTSSELIINSSTTWLDKLVPGTQRIDVKNTSGTPLSTYIEFIVSN